MIDAIIISGLKEIMNFTSLCEYQNPFYTNTYALRNKLLKNIKMFSLLILTNVK